MAYSTSQEFEHLNHRLDAIERKLNEQGPIERAVRRVAVGAVLTAGTIYFTGEEIVKMWSDPERREAFVVSKMRAWAERFQEATEYVEKVADDRLNVDYAKEPSDESAGGRSVEDEIAEVVKLRDAYMLDSSDGNLLKWESKTSEVYQLYNHPAVRNELCMIEAEKAMKFVDDRCAKLVYSGHGAALFAADGWMSEQIERVRMQPFLHARATAWLRVNHFDRMADHVSRTEFDQHGKRRAAEGVAVADAETKPRG